MRAGEKETVGVAFTDKMGFLFFSSAPWGACGA
jgi:hypothetical protein